MLTKRIIYSALVAVAFTAAGCGGIANVLGVNTNVTGTWAGDLTLSQAFNGTTTMPVTMSLSQIGTSVSGTLAEAQPSAGVIQLNVSGTFNGSSGTLTATNGNGCTEVDQISAGSGQMSIQGSSSGNCPGGAYSFSGVLTQRS